MNKPISPPVSNSCATFKILELPGGFEMKVTLTELRQRFDRDGVVVLPDFLNESELVPIRHELDAYYAPLAPRVETIHNGKGELGKYACDVIAWHALRENNEVFQALASQSRLAEITEITLGGGFSASDGMAMYSIGGGRGQAWHQDCPPGDNQGFNLNRLFYTDDVSLDDGAIVVVPGSHRFGRIPPGGHQDPMEGELVLTPRAGTLVLLHGHVYHRVTPNLNMKPRVSVNFRAFPAGVSKDVNCIGVYRNGSVNFCDKPKMHDGTPAEMPMTQAGN